jgi:two-component system, NarL family, invasion response regulator UvrY
MIRVVVVDDHAIVREGLKRILSETSDIAVTGEAADEREALEVIRREPCDVVVTDISMPGRGGLDLIDEMRRRHCGVPALVLSVHGEEELAIRALKAGAAGYVTKNTAPRDLLRAIRKVSRGGRYVTESVAERLASRLDPARGETLQDRLSDREFQVLCMMARGKATREVAEELALGVKTVETYRIRLRRKLGVKSIAALIAYAIRHKLGD